MDTSAGIWADAGEVAGTTKARNQNQRMTYVPPLHQRKLNGQREHSIQSGLRSVIAGGATSGVSTGTRFHGSRASSTLQHRYPCLQQEAPCAA